MLNRPIRNFLDLSGFTFSGKSAVIEFVREIDGFCVPDANYEFALIRCQDGLMDLEKALVDDWSPVRCTAAIRRFKNLTDLLGRAGTRYRIGNDYDRRYNGIFTKRANEYINKLIKIEWDAWWPYAWHDYSTAELLWNKLKSKLNHPDAFHSRLYLATGENFIEETRSFLHDILTAPALDSDDTIVMHNSIEPYNPMRGLAYFQNAKSIIVFRDPRDNFAALTQHSPRFRAVAGSNSVDTFIQRYRILRLKSDKATVDPKYVMKIQYEDLIDNYDATTQNILKFLEIDPRRHINPKKHFNPSASQRYVGLWRSYTDQGAIQKIMTELSEYCVT